MANRTVADDWFALNDLGDDGDIVVRKKDANTLTDHAGVAADCDQVPVAGRMDRDVTGETEDTFCTRFQ